MAYLLAVILIGSGMAGAWFISNRNGNEGESTATASTGANRDEPRSGAAPGLDMPVGERVELARGLVEKGVMGVLFAFRVDEPGLRPWGLR